MNDGCVVLNVMRLARDGLFDGRSQQGSLSWKPEEGGGSAGSMTYALAASGSNEYRIELRYQAMVGRRRRDFEESIAALCETGHEEGDRWWFRCPFRKDGRPCGRRTVKLFLPPGRSRFGCRFCHDLTYVGKG